MPQKGSTNFLLSLQYLALMLTTLLGIVYGINGGVFWDDWTLNSLQAIEQQFGEVGSPQTGYFHTSLLNILNRELWYRIILFASELGIVLILLKLIQRIPNDFRSYGYLALLIFIAAPMNAAKVTLIMTPASLLVFLFFLGTFFLIESEIRNQLVFRFVAALLFLFSFTLNSLLVFYLVPFLLVFFRKVTFTHVTSFKDTLLAQISVKRLLFYADVILLPLFFWILRPILFPIQGLHASTGYNSLSLGGLMKAPILLLKTFYTSVVRIIMEFYLLLSDDVIFYFLLFALVGSLVFVVGRKALFKVHLNRFQFIGLLSIGFSCFVLGAAAYVLVGKVPSFIGYESRHQILLPAGISILAVAFLALVSRFRNLAIGLSALVVALFFTVQVGQQIQFIKGWIKQEAIKVEFEENNVIRNNQTFFFKDRCPEWNASERDFAFYNLNGISVLAFGDESRLIIGQKEFMKNSARFDGILKNSVSFNMQDYGLSEPQFKIVVSRAPYTKLGPFKALHLAWSYHFNKSVFFSAINKLIIVETFPLQK